MRDTTLPIEPDELAAHADRLRALVRRLVVDGDRADDIVQETHLVALTRQRRANVPVYAWLAGVARNLVRRDRRSRARRGRHEAAAARPDLAGPAADVVERADFVRVLVQLIVSLDEPYRRTLLLRYFDGLEPREIAERLGVPASTVRSHVKRGLDLLRERLDDRHGGDRSAWLAACAPFLDGTGTPGWTAVAPRGAATAPGVAIMASTKTSAAVVAILLIVGGLTWLTTREGSGGGARPAAPVAQSTETRPMQPHARGRAVDVRSPEPEAAAAPTSPAAVASGRVTGRVILPDGMPAVGAAVRLSVPNARWAETDRDGRFSIDSSNAGDHVSVWVVATGYRSPPIPPVAVARDAEVAMPDVRLEPDSEIVLHGHLRSKAGRSVAGGRVKLWWGSTAGVNGQLPGSDPGLYEVVAISTALNAHRAPPPVRRLIDLSFDVGADGRFSLALPAALGRAGLMATAPGHVTGWGPLLRLADVAGTDVEIALTALPRAKG